VGGWKAAVPFHVQLFFYEWRLIERELRRSQPGLLWVAPQVTRATPEMLRIANHPVEIILHPEISTPVQQPIHFACRKSFPALQHIFEIVSFDGREQRMNMIGHHYPGVLPIAYTIEVVEGLTDNLADRRFAQNAASRAFVEPCLDACSKAAVILLFLLGGPRGRVPFQPGFALGPPGIEPVLR